MLPIVIAIALGIAVGAFNLAPEWFYKIIDKVMVVVLFVLLFNPKNKTLPSVVPGDIVHRKLKTINHD